VKPSQEIGRAFSRLFPHFPGIMREPAVEVPVLAHFHPPKDRKTGVGERGKDRNDNADDEKFRELHPAPRK
jgi:hypothetical protein